MLAGPTKNGPFGAQINFLRPLAVTKIRFLRPLAVTESQSRLKGPKVGPELQLEIAAGEGEDYIYNRVDKTHSYRYFSFSTSIFTRCLLIPLPCFDPR